MTFKKAIFGIIAVLVVHYIAIFLGLYEILRWWDIPMHFFGGVVIGMLGLAVYQEGIAEVRFKGMLEKHLRFWFVYVFVAGFVAVVAIGWEIHEYLLDLLVTHVVRQPSIADTMLDLVLGLLGSLVAVLVFHKHKK